MANSADVLYCWQLGQGVKIIFGSQNRHKLKEINCISKQYGIEFISPNTNFNPVENGSTFEENSYIKAKEAAILSKNMALADDSGLCVDFLGGDPGIYSARYAETKSKCTEKLLKKLENVSNRRAKFVCALTLVDHDGNILCQEIGECYGRIATEEKGTNGFGYDPIFIPDGYDISLGEMDADTKNSISHRNIALKKVIRYIVTNFHSAFK